MNTRAIENRVLVIDDDPLVREVICASLEMLGYQVLAAESGESGIELFRQEKPQIVFTDMMFPGMDGSQVVAAVRNLKPETFIVTVSGLSSLKVKSDAFLNKPFTHKELRQVLEQARLHLSDF